MTPEKIRWGLSSKVMVSRTPDQIIFEFYMHFKKKAAGELGLYEFCKVDDEELMALWAQFLFEKEE